MRRYKQQRRTTTTTVCNKYYCCEQYHHHIHHPSWPKAAFVASLRDFLCWSTGREEKTWVYLSRVISDQPSSISRLAGTILLTHLPPGQVWRMISSDRPWYTAINTIRMYVVAIIVSCLVRVLIVCFSNSRGMMWYTHTWGTRDGRWHNHHFLLCRRAADVYHVPCIAQLPCNLENSYASSSTTYYQVLGKYLCTCSLHLGLVCTKSVCSLTFAYVRNTYIYESVSKKEVFCGENKHIPLWTEI